MEKARTSIFFIILAWGFIWAFSSAVSGFAETSLPVAADPAALQADLPYPHNSQPMVSVRSAAAVVRGADRPLPLWVLAKEPKESLTIEPAGKVSLERLRREQARYPDQDILGRLVEVATQCPPLFESN